MSSFNTAPPTIAAIEADVLQFGEGLMADVVVIGNAAVALAFGDEAWRRHDLDISVTEDAYRYLRDQPGWVEEQLLDGRYHILNGYYDIGTNWGTTTHDDLSARAWHTENGGVQVAGPSDLYAQKQERGFARDDIDTSLIRARLQDPEQAPIPMHIMKGIEGIVRSSLPAHLQDDPIAIRLITENVLTEYTLYGDPRIGRINQIIGDLELPEYGVPATYHNGFGLVQEIRRMSKRFTDIERADQEAGRRLTFTREDQYDAIIAHTGGDAIYGSGRESDSDVNGGQYDELRSANRLWSRAVQLGYSYSRATRLHTMVDMTGFNERTGKQKGRRHPDPAVREVPGADLYVTSEPESVEVVVDGLALEDGFSARFSRARVLGRVAAEQGVRIRTKQEGIVFVDEYRDSRPAGALDGPTVIEVWAGRIMGNADFIDPDSEKGYQAPDGYPINPAMRRLHAAKSRSIAGRLIAGTLDAVGASAEAKAHTEEMRERFDAE